MNVTNLEGVIGAALGIVAGLVGTYFSIRNTRGARERRFVICVAVVAWVTLAILAAAVFLLPSMRGWVPIVLVFMVVVGVPLMNRRQEIIRREDAFK